MLPLEIEEDDAYSTSSLDDCRTHFMDNLRTTVTVLLIVQHAIIETAASSYPDFHSLTLPVFVTITKTIVVGLFFFISGFAASMSRNSPSSSTSYYCANGRTDAEFIWSRTIRLLLPGIVYGAAGHAVVWMFLTKTWPTFFGAAGSVSTDDGYSTPVAWGFARFEGPVVHILFLYFLDIAYVLLRPTKRHGSIAGGVSLSPLPRDSRPASPDHPHASKHTKFRMANVKTPKDWYKLVSVGLGLLILWTFAVAAGGGGEKSLLRFGFNVASYDKVVPSAPFQYILAYMAGTRLYKWQTSILIPHPYTFPALFGSVFASVALLLVALASSPVLREMNQLNTPWPVHPSFIDGGFNFHAFFFAVWNASTFFTISVSLVSVFAQWEWTRRDWGPVARHSYVPAWLHMIPVVFFVKLLAADGGWSPSKATSPGAAAPALTHENVVWRCFLVATGSVICSWFIGLTVASVGWLTGW